MEKPGLDGRRGSQMGLLSREAVGIRTVLMNDGEESALPNLSSTAYRNMRYLGTVQ